jgi:hypothetical protein
MTLAKKRVFLAEWWEIWWQKPGKDSTLVSSPWPGIGRRPPHTYGSYQAALEAKKKQQNSFLRILHVRRFRRTSQSDV